MKVSCLAGMGKLCGMRWHASHLVVVYENDHGGYTISKVDVKAAAAANQKTPSSSNARQTVTNAKSSATKSKKTPAKGQSNNRVATSTQTKSKDIPSKNQTKNRIRETATKEKRSKNHPVKKKIEPPKSSRSVKTRTEQAAGGRDNDAVGQTCSQQKSCEGKNCLFSLLLRKIFAANVLV